MVGKAAEACPTLLSPGSAPLSELRELAETKAAARLPPDFAKNLVAATLGVELTNKVRFCITSKDLFVSDLWNANNFFSNSFRLLLFEVYLHHSSKIKSHNEVRKQCYRNKGFPLFLLDDGRIRIGEAQKLTARVLQIRIRTLLQTDPRTPIQINLKECKFVRIKCCVKYGTVTVGAESLCRCRWKVRYLKPLDL